MCPANTHEFMTVFPKDISHEPVATCPITVAGAVSTIHVQQSKHGKGVGSRGPRCFLGGGYVAGTAWCRVQVGTPEGDKSRFPPDKDGPGRGWDGLFVGSDVIWVCVRSLSWGAQAHVPAHVLVLSDAVVGCERGMLL